MPIFDSITVPAWTWLLVIQPFGICLGVVVLYYVARRK